MISGPEHPERPLVVRAGLGAFVAELVLGVIELAAQLRDFDTFVDQSVRPLVDDPRFTPEMLRLAGWLSVAFLLLFAGVQALFIWFAWRRRNWARIVLVALGGVGAVGLVSALGDTGGRAGFTTSMDVFRLLITVAGLGLLLQKPAQEWYRAPGRGPGGAR